MADAAFAMLVAAAGISASSVVALSGVDIPILIVGVLGAAIAAAIRSLRRPPSDVELLSDVDRQLCLRDLLSTAITLPADDSRPTAQAVRAAASAQAATIDVERIVASRPRGPGVSTAVLALAASVALAFTLAPTPMTRADRAIRSTPDSARPDTASRTADVAGDAAGRRAEPAESWRERAGGEATAATMSGDHRAEGSRDDGRGRSAGASGALVPPPPPMRDAATPLDAGQPTAGLGGVGTSTGDAGGRGSATAGRETLAGTAAELDRATASAVARRAVDENRVPARSRDLVRAYFGLDGDDARGAR